MNKRDFLTASLGVGVGLGLAGAARAQQRPAPGPPPASTATPRPSVPHRMVKTTPLFKAPPGLPNAVAVTPEGLWIAEQKLSGATARQYGLTDPTDLREACWLVDWTGKILRTVMTESRNTSGMAVGDGFIWMGANAPPQGIFQTDMNSKTISHRQIPLGPPDNGGGCHGCTWHEGKLWIISNRLRGLLRVDPKTWTPEFMISITADRWHGTAYQDGGFWVLNGNQSTSFATGKASLVKYNATTGALMETADFVPGSADPHGLAVHNGTLISCDAGIHPGWPNFDSPFAGQIFRIDFV